MRALLLLIACHAAPALMIVPQQVKQGETTVVPLVTSLGLSVISHDGLTADSDGKTLAIHAGHQVAGRQQRRPPPDQHQRRSGHAVGAAPAVRMRWPDAVT